MYPSQLMLSKIKNRESRRTHSVSTTKRVFAAFRQCLKRVCLAPPLESTLFSPRECPEGCLPEELERPWRKAVPPQTDCRRKGDASPFPACRQWLCGGWRFLSGKAVFLFCLGLVQESVGDTLSRGQCEIGSGRQGYTNYKIYVLQNDFGAEIPP